MKAIAVFDIPEWIHVAEEKNITHMRAMIDVYDSCDNKMFTIGVQLKPLPKKYEYYDMNEQPKRLFRTWKAIGWNSCLAEILGETE